MSDTADDTLRSLGAGICPFCSNAVYLLARTPFDVYMAGLVEIRPSLVISWCDGIEKRQGESFHEVCGHTADPG
jgi:hypothetical protein